jgi:chromosomal replication initiator protein
MTMTAINEVTPTAAQFVCAVADMDARETHHILLGLSREQLMALAASVDMEKPLGESNIDPSAAVVSRVAVAVANHLNVMPHDLYGPSREREIVEARQVTCWIASALKISSSAIGRALNRDHSTVLHSVEKVTSTPQLLTKARRIHDQLDREAA